MKIVITGTGYMELVTGACLSEVGNSVTIVDNDEIKLQKMKQKVSPTYESGLVELLKRNHDEGRLNFTVDYKNAYRDAELVFIGVGISEREDDSNNLDYVFNTCKQILENISKDCLVIVKSTVPLDSNNRMEEFFKENVKNNVYVEIESNSEFLAQEQQLLILYMLKEQ